ncbi:hypothetical protein ACEPPN_005862 [Leptodophora sp. 'Broadleaf-Isolate-01']
MAEERLGRGLAPQGSAAPRRPSPYHHLEIFETIDYYSNEEPLISFDEDGDTKSAKVTLSFIQSFQDVVDSRTQDDRNSSPASTSLSNASSSKPTDTCRKPAVRKPIPRSLLDDDVNAPPRSPGLRETTRAKPQESSSNEPELESFLLATGERYTPFNPYTISRTAARTTVAQSQTVSDREEGLESTASSPTETMKPSTNATEEVKHLCDQTIADKLRATLESCPNDLEQEELFQNDENTAWFGVVKDESGDSAFYDYGRYADIMTEISKACSPRRRHGSRFPGLEPAKAPLSKF